MPADDGRFSTALLQQRIETPPMPTFGEAVARMVGAAERTRSPERNVAMIYTIFCTGMYPVEIAQLRVSDYLQSNNQVRHVSQVRREASLRNYARPLLWANPRLRASMDTYLAFRLRSGHGLGRSDRYRGLDPHSFIFLKADGSPYKLAERRAGMNVLWVFRRVATAAGIKVTAREARRWLALRMFEMGGDVDKLLEVLGIKKEVEFYRFIAVDPAVHNSVGRLTTLMRSVV